MKCVFKLLLPESFQQRNWQVFWLAPSSMPSHSHRTVAWRFEDTSELTAAVSAQDFHLIPFSLIAPRIEEMNTKFSGKYTEDFLICKQNCDIYRKSSFIHPIPPPILSLYLHFIQRRTNLLINSIYWVVVLTTPDAISYTGNV